MQRQTRFRRWASSWDAEDATTWLTRGLWFVAIVAAVVLGFIVGQNMQNGPPSSPNDGTPPPVEKPAKPPEKASKAQGAQ